MDIDTQLSAVLAGRYLIERKIGAGGMAHVYLARDVRHHRRVALKVLRPEVASQLGTQRFLGEIEITANLQHPHILPLFDSGEADGLLFYVTPYVEGETLRHRLKREGQLPVEEAVQIAVHVASALGYAHRHGVIHRDLKPENILLLEGEPMVMDFGIALAVAMAASKRLTATGLSMGTPKYMSPEQATADRRVDGRTDIYSLGCVLYEMLTGEPPHTGRTPQAVMAKVLTEKAMSVRIVRETVPEQVDAAIQVALSKVPADRFESATEFAEALTGARRIRTPSESTPVAARHATANPRSARGGGTNGQLAAVMFTDIVGYTALMQRDEAAALLVRSRHRQAIERVVSGHDGQVLQFLGDGSLSTFRSAIGAVSASIDIQRELSNEPSVPLRIGIHQGEISCDEQGVYGDSLNIASRLQSLAPEGGVLVSEKVFDEIKNQRSFPATYLGKVTLKNVERPVGVYALTAAGLTVRSASLTLPRNGAVNEAAYPSSVVVADLADPSDTAPSVIESDADFPIGRSTRTRSLAIPSPRRKHRAPVVAGFAAVLGTGAMVWLAWPAVELDPRRVAVAPFENRSGIDSVNGVGSILADALRNGLQRSGLVNVAPSSPNGRAESLDPKALAKKTRAGFIITGSFTMRGDSIVIQPQIVNAIEDRVLGTRPAMVHITALENLETSLELALVAQLNPRIADLAARSDLPTSRDAYNAFQRGLELHFDGQHRAALGYFHRAVRLDSTSGSLLLWLAATTVSAHVHMSLLPQVRTTTDSILRIVERFKNRMPLYDLTLFDYLQAGVHGNRDEALRAARELAAMGNPVFLARQAWRLNYRDEAYEAAEAELKAGAGWFREEMWTILAHLDHARGNHERELQHARDAIREVGESDGTLRALIPALAALGRVSDLYDALEKLKALTPASPAFRAAARELRWHNHDVEAKKLSLIAAGWYREALANGTNVRRLLAGTMFDLGLWDEARRMYETLAAEIPPDLEAVGYLGIDAARRGSTSLAEATIERLTELDSQNPGFGLLWSARIAAAMGRCERAVTFLQRAYNRGLFHVEEIPEFRPLTGCTAYDQLMKPRKTSSLTQPVRLSHSARQP